MNDRIKKMILEDLRAWFSKGKKGGAGGGGWDRYNTKGERIGKCGERKPNEGKPKCLSKSKAASLRASGGKKAIAAAVNKKRREDPNPDRKGGAKMVSNKVKKESVLNESEEKLRQAYKYISSRMLNASGVEKELMQRKLIELQQLAKRYGIDLQKDSLQKFVENFECPHCHGPMYPEGTLTESAKKDACYHKVKSRYKVWPSAYASGALVKCRKAGASNWGNKSKKTNEELQHLPFGTVNVVTPAEHRAKRKKFVDDLIADGVPEKTAYEVLDFVRQEVFRGADWDTAVEVAIDRYGIDDPYRLEREKEREQSYNADQERVRQQTVKTLQNFYRQARQREGREKIQAIALLQRHWHQATPEQKAELTRQFGDDPRWQEIMRKVEQHSRNTSLDESGLQYYTGKKKYGKDGMKALAKAGREGASQEELGRIKDKFIKKEEVELDEACWKGYEKKGMKTMFGKKYPNCVKKTK